MKFLELKKEHLPEYFRRIEEKIFKKNEKFHKTKNLIN